MKAKPLLIIMLAAFTACGKYEDGAATGRIVAENNAWFAQHDAERIKYVEAAAETRRQKELEAQHTLEAHNAVWGEIEHLRKLEQASQ